MADAPGNTPSPPADLIEIPPHEFQNYYFTRNRRLFPQLRLPVEQRDLPDPPLPSVLPVDGREMDRRTVQHNLVHLALNHRNYFGPFIECLTPPARKVVLDVGSASGKWIEEVSDMMHHEPSFYGIELVPHTATENDNVYFTVYDFQREGLNHGNATLDVVHARFQIFHILDWPNFLREVSRVLKPGGLFMSAELDIHLEYTNEREWPATRHLYNHVWNNMYGRDYSPDIAVGMVQRLESMVDDQGVPMFTNCESQTISIPVGRSPNIPGELGLNAQQQLELSVLAMDCLKSLASSLKPFLLSTGLVDVEVNGLVEAHRQELDQRNAKMTYRMTWARRR